MALGALLPELGPDGLGRVPLIEMMARHAAAKPDAPAYTFVDYSANPGGAKITLTWAEIESKYRGYRLRSDAPAVRIASDGLRGAGFEPRLVLSGGAADANVFNERGLACVNLANGMVDIHTADERIAVDDLERMVEVTLAIVAAAREAAEA